MNDFMELEYYEWFDTKKKTRATIEKALLIASG